MPKEKDKNYALKVANKQRLTALKNAFKTIDSFMEVSYTPDMDASYQKVKKYLLKMYSKK